MNYYPWHNKPVLRRSLEPEQYVSIRYSERLKEAGIKPSVGSLGDSYVNALAETINGLYKAETIHRQAWKSKEAVELATLAWVDLLQPSATAGADRERAASRGGSSV